MLVGLSAAGVGGRRLGGRCAECVAVVSCGGWVLVSLLLVLLGLLMRDLSGVRLVLMAASGGLVGNLLLELHCAVGEVPHLMLGHVMLSILLVGASFGWSFVGEAREGVCEGCVGVYHTSAYFVFFLGYSCQWKKIV